ncbi:helix-turn-helix transcriptional regulator [Athalassotoga sp.]|uniref:helix-turn-helix transcriptional regulator n=1 Tax=Athalassotoga sp. TaxID=2022597 RepID=UPI003D08AD9D
MNIRELRESKGLSRSKLARILNIDTMTIYNVEKGRCRPQPKTAIALAKFFEIPIEEIRGKKLEKGGRK